MKTIVLGANGQLGRELCRVLPGDVCGLTRRDVDLADAPTLRRAIEARHPQLVVNAAGFTAVDRAESAPAEAFAVNALAVRELAIVCRDIGATLIHFGTNYVFGLDELRTKPYSEFDAPGPLNVYGISKLAGEHFIRALC